jgi:ABC-type antimicrobial peptide transport system permease subunit
MAGFRMVSPEYFDVVKQRLIAGRTFAPTDAANTPLVAIITPGIAHALWPGEDAIGKTIATNYLINEWLTVVGVAAEASNWAQPKGAQNEIFVPYAQHLHALAGQNQIVAMIRTEGSPDALTTEARASLRRSLPGSAATFRTMADRIARTAADRRFAMMAVTGFAVVALVLAAVGIYGVFGYVVATQSRDIGVRLALGATPWFVRRSVLVGAATIAAAGCAAGALTALATSRYLQASLFGISRQDPLTYTASIVVVTLAVLVGAWVPARRASAVDPLVAMRQDG